MTKTRASITPLVSTAIVIVVTNVLFVFGIVVYQRGKAQAMQRYTVEQATLANQLQVALQLGVWNFDHPQIDRVLDAAMGSEDVAAVRLIMVDRQFTVNSRGRDSSWRPVHLPTLNPPSSGWSRETRIISVDDTPVATLELYGTPHSLAADLRRVRNTIIVATLLLDVVLIAAMSYLLYRLVLAPIKRIENEAAAVSGGDRESLTRPDGYFAREFGRLRESIASMVDQLDARFVERQQAEERYREIIEGVLDVVFSLSPTGEIVSLNPAFERVTGWPTSKWLGQSFVGLLRGEDAVVAAAIVQGIMQGTEESIGRVYRILCADGRYIKAEIHLAARRKNGEVTGLLGIGRDVTDRYDLEEQLRQAQKMEAIGRLAGGVAHDFNNLLTIIQGRSAILMEQLERTPELKSEAEEIDRAAESAASMTRQLLAFSRQQVLQPTVVDFARVVGATERMLRRLVGTNIKLETRIDPQMGHIRADVGQIEQVLVNLVVNARDAMPNGGSLNLHAEQVTLADPLAELPPGRYAKLTVRDSGVGMDAATRAKVFEPFFTTKGQGTGLGLATVYGVVTQSGGAITVESEEGQGTTFTVYLPIVEPPVSVPVPMREAATAVRSATILLVEDMESVRSMMSDTLKRAKHKVIAVGDAESAIEVHAAGEAPIDLLVTDLMMPDIGGRELAERLRVLTPTLKVLYVSGYSASDSKVEIQEDGSWFLQKPFTPRVFAEKVRECLE